MHPRLRSVSRRAQSLVRLILGPSHPSQTQTQMQTLPLPQSASSCSAGITCSRRSLSASPDSLISRVSSRHPSLRWAVYPFLAIWLVGYILLIRQQYYLPDSPDIVSCTAAPWDDWPPDTCGVNGEGCQDGLVGIDGEAFRCMGGCKDTTLGNSRWIGGEEIGKEALIVGGGDVNRTYRADSWLCAAAIHSKLISPSLGGCITFHALPYPSGYSNFLGSTSSGLSSMGFPPSFPGAFRLSKLPSAGCMDLHYLITGYNALCLFVFTLSSPRPAVLYSLILLLGYTQIVLVSDAPSQPPVWEDILSGFFPVLFAGYWIYQTSFRRTMHSFRGLPFEGALWQGAGYWIGIESSTIFARLPISRLGYDPLDPAGVVALTCIVVVVVIVVLMQAWQMRKSGWLQYYLVRYIWLAPILLVLALIPNYTLRLHHYLLALAAIPVLSLPNRISLFFQAFMLGLFLDGVGRWGWASIIEETTSLVGDANAGTTTPSFLANTTTADILSWTGITAEQMASNVNITGFSVLVDDIQKLANYANDTLSLRMASLDLNLADGIDHYFRLAYIANGSSLDFTEPITRLANGSWSGIG